MAARRRMSYLTQMLGLTVQNFVSAATGMAVLVALIRGLRAALGADHRQLLGRSDAERRSTSCCRSRSCSRWSWCPRAWSRPSARTRRPPWSSRPSTTSPRPTRTASRARRQGPAQDEEVHADRAGHRGRARPPRRSRSSSSAPTAAASSTSTRRIRSRTRRRSSNFLEMLVDPADPRRALLHVRRHGRRHAARAGRCSRP